MVTTLTLIDGTTYYSKDSQGTLNMKINGACKGVGSNAMYEAYTDSALTIVKYINLEFVLTTDEVALS